MNSITIDNMDIKLVNYYKCIGIILDNKIKYSLHIICYVLNDRKLYIFLKNYPFST